jgi:hypothetical protein
MVATWGARRRAGAFPLVKGRFNRVELASRACGPLPAEEPKPIAVGDVDVHRVMEHLALGRVHPVDDHVHVGLVPAIRTSGHRGHR